MELSKGKMQNLIKCGGCGKKPRVAATKIQPTNKSVISNVTNNPPPANRRSSTGKPSIFDKLTDPSLYTGAHKLRFDKDGKGLGKEGRDTLGFNEVDVLGRSKPGLVPTRTFDGKTSDAKQSLTQKPNSGGSTRKSGGPSIFDKLTDASLYTGAHKQRFDSTGRGRGLAGRDAASGISRDDGKVTNIGQSGFLRPGF